MNCSNWWSLISVIAGILIGGLIAIFVAIYYFRLQKYAQMKATLNALNAFMLRIIDDRLGELKSIRDARGQRGSAGTFVSYESFHPTAFYFIADFLGVWMTAYDETWIRHLLRNKIGARLEKESWGSSIVNKKARKKKGIQEFANGTWTIFATLYHLYGVCSEDNERDLQDIRPSFESIRNGLLNEVRFKQKEEYKKELHERIGFEQQKKIDPDSNVS